MSDDMKQTEVTATVVSAEFVEGGDENRLPGTYVTFRADDPNIGWRAGRVAIRYLPKAPPEPEQ